MVICIIDSREFLLFNIDYWEIENESRGDYYQDKRCVVVNAVQDRMEHYN